MYNVGSVERYRLWLEMQVIFSAAAPLSLPSPEALPSMRLSQDLSGLYTGFCSRPDPQLHLSVGFDALDIQNQSMHVVHALQIDAKCDLHSHAASRPVSLVLASLNSVSSLVALLRCPLHSPIM